MGARNSFITHEKGLSDIYPYLSKYRYLYSEWQSLDGLYLANLAAIINIHGRFNLIQVVNIMSKLIAHTLYWAV